MAVVAGAHEPTRRGLATAEALCRASCCEVLCVGKVFFGFNHKIMIKFRSRHLVLWSLGTYGLRESE